MPSASPAYRLSLTSPPSHQRQLNDLLRTAHLDVGEVIEAEVNASWPPVPGLSFTVAIGIHCLLAPPLGLLQNDDRVLGVSVRRSS